MGLFVLVFGMSFLLFLFLFSKGNMQSRMYSKAVLVLLFVSILVNVALAQNYPQSLLPYPVNDGLELQTGSPAW